MRFYIDKNYEVFTEEQFKERFFTKEIIFSMLLDGVLQDEFIKICSICSGSNTIKDAVDHFIQEIQWDTKLLLKYCEYIEVEQREINKKFIERILKDN